MVTKCILKVLLEKYQIENSFMSEVIKYESFFHKR
jgi:hypothetical protein